MTETIENIYNDFRQNFVDTSDYAVDFYERHSILLNNIKQFKDKEELRFYIEIICKYAEGLLQKDRLNLAVDVIDNRQLLIDNEIRRLNADDIKDSWYHSLQFINGMASYKLKDYKTSTQIFKKLVQVDSSNDNYKDWLSYSKYGLRLWLIRTINIFCVLLIVTEVIFKSQIDNFYVRQTMLIVGTLGLLSNLAFEYYLKRNRRRTK